jgi:hypothetical protein
MNPLSEFHLNNRQIADICQKNQISDKQISLRSCDTFQKKPNKEAIQMLRQLKVYHVAKENDKLGIYETIKSLS